MSAIPKGFSSNIRAEGPPNYYFQEEIIGNDNSSYRASLYDDVLSLEQRRIYDFDDYAPEMKLEKIEDEIKGRIKITQNEIFTIGELLDLGKKACMERGLSFQKWINENFDFSYETANNFMNVFRYCLGIRKIAQNIPASILYKISKPKFPEELRIFLLKQGNLNKLTNGNLELLVKKFKEGGLEAIESDVEGFLQAVQIFKQTRYSFDICEDSLRKLENLHNRLRKRQSLQFNDVSESAKINRLLEGTLCKCIKTLSEALNESGKIIGNYVNRIEDKYRNP